jgi:hypothetical protein
MRTHNISLYSHMPERRGTLACGVDLHNAICRKGAVPERAVMAVTRFASFVRMETVTKAGLKANKRFNPKLPMPETRDLGSRDP